MCREKPGAMTLELPCRSGNATGLLRSFVGSRGSGGGTSLIRTSDRSTTATRPSACTSTAIVTPPSPDQWNPSSAPRPTSMRREGSATPNRYGRAAQRSARNLARAPGTWVPGSIGWRGPDGGRSAPRLSNSASRSSRVPRRELVLNGLNGRISATESPRHVIVTVCPLRTCRRTSEKRALASDAEYTSFMDLG